MGNGPDCGEFTLATLAEFVLAPKLEIEPEIGKVVPFEFAVNVNETHSGSSIVYVVWRKLPH